MLSPWQIIYENNDAKTNGAIMKDFHIVFCFIPIRGEYIEIMLILAVEHCTICHN